MNKAKTPMEQILHTAESIPISSDPRWSDIVAKDTALTKIADIARDEVFPPAASAGEGPKGAKACGETLPLGAGTHDDPRPHHCLLPAGHAGRHFCHICGIYWNSVEPPPAKDAPRSVSRVGTTETERLHGFPCDICGAKNFEEAGNLCRGEGDCPGNRMSHEVFAEDAPRGKVRPECNTCNHACVCRADYMAYQSEQCPYYEPPQPAMDWQDALHHIIIDADRALCNGSILNRDGANVIHCLKDRAKTALQQAGIAGAKGGTE